MSEGRIDPGTSDPLEPLLRAGPLSASGTVRLWKWLGVQRRAHSWGLAVSAAEVRAVLRPVCDDARCRGARVEQLIVLLKELWAMLPPETAARRLAERGSIDWRAHDRALFDLLVRICIDEYFSPVPAADGRGRAAARVDDVAPA
ncbi:MAG TPA: hypothetical protein VF761_13220 [Gemmatimonadaceae bacterium]